MIRGDASQVFELADDLGKISSKAVPTLRSVVDESGKTLAQEWRSNASVTSGAHGKHYPNAITSELLFGVTQIVAEVGPETHRKQGGMGPGFEFGSRNQPPHLDGLRALDVVQPRMERMADAAIGHLFG